MMAKKRRKSKYKGLGLVDGLIDLAGGAAMNVVANHMEEKYHYTAKGKINPYRVSAIGIASGRLKTTKDIMRAGAYLGAKGSFNVTTDPPGKDPNERYWSPADEIILSDDPLLNAIGETVGNDNRYAWRYNCQDGSAYGVHPENYETREDYNFALMAAMAVGAESIANCPQRRDNSVSRTESDRSEHDSRRIYWTISRLDNGSTERHLAGTPDAKIGDIVEIDIDNRLIKAVVVGIERANC